MQNRNAGWLLPNFCPGMGWRPGPRAHLLFHADTHHCFCCACGFSELLVSTSYKRSLHSPDLCMGSISKVTFPLFSLAGSIADSTLLHINSYKPAGLHGFRAPAPCPAPFQVMGHLFRDPVLGPTLTTYL